MGYDILKTTDQEIRDRILREASAHDDDDVLKKSRELKDRFPHVLISPSRLQLERDIDSGLGKIRGMRVLDIGCGEGERGLELAEKGALVDGIDISKTYVDRARAGLLASGLGDSVCVYAVMDAHNMTFPDDKFDLVIGRGIIHHLDLRLSIVEITRVLKPGGVALFMEPLADNPLLRVFRWLTPGARTVDERPLGKKDLEYIAHGRSTSNSYYGLITTPVAILSSILWPWNSDNIVMRTAYRLEKWLNKKKWALRFNQYVLIRFTKTG